MWYWGIGKERRTLAEFFREEKRRIGCGDRSEVEAPLRDAKVALKHSLLLSLHSGIG